MRMAWWARRGGAGVSQCSVSVPFWLIWALRADTEKAAYNGFGNYGQMDLVAALQWVAGQYRSLWWRIRTRPPSLASLVWPQVLSLMASPKGEGVVFNRADHQSGTLLSGYPFACCREAVGLALQSRLASRFAEEMASDGPGSR